MTIMLTGAKTETSKTKQTIRFLIPGELDSIDPALATMVASGNVLLQLFEGLTMPDVKNGGVQPGVAERWTISEDSKTYTFYLRKDAKWSDGTPVTTNDFVYAWTRVLTPETGALASSRLSYVKNGQAFLDGTIKDPKQLGFKAMDDYTLQVTLENPFPPFLEMTNMQTLFPVKKEVVEKYGDQWTRPEHIVSNGIFFLKESVFDDKMVFEKNPHYWDRGNVKIDQAIGVVVDDLMTAIKRYMAGELDVVDTLPNQQIRTLKNRSDFYSVPGFGVYVYAINTKVPVLDKAKVRRALSLAIDRKIITDKVLQGGGDSSNDLFPCGNGRLSLSDRLGPL